MEEKPKHINEPEISGVAKIRKEFHCAVVGGEEKKNFNKKDKKKLRKQYILKDNMCLNYVRFGKCDRGEDCKYSHDTNEYIRQKPINIDSTCINIARDGNCPYGVTCRFNHDNIENKQKGVCPLQSEANQISHEILKSLRKREYKYDVKSDIEKETNLNFDNKLYLAPLTTVGNLPFRRICKEMGADITCSEMVLATSLLQGKKSEWALVRRHETEDIFGVQIAGSNAESLKKCVRLICDNISVEFIDLNMGCPIDIMFNKGVGCSMMRNIKKTVNIVSSMVKESNVPITVKMRSGIKDDAQLAHRLLPEFSKIGVFASTIHARSREQRYSKLADWSYIEKCVGSCDIPLIGNGDVISYRDYVDKLCFNTRGVMIGRGALMKPWVFKEIKEKRLWDISSRERLDVVRKYCDYGLEHWGTDMQGVEKTRVFLLEWLSYLCRYVPVGVLENPPQRINQRAESFKGRDDLEILLSSNRVEDWLKISSMFLGTPPDGFHFSPKHKSSAYG